MWSLLVVWAMVDATFQDMWIVVDPQFNSKDQCIQYGMLYRESIMRDAMTHFNTREAPISLYCIDEAAKLYLHKKGYQVEQL